MKINRILLPVLVVILCLSFIVLALYGTYANDTTEEAEPEEIAEEPVPEPIPDETTDQPDAEPIPEETSEEPETETPPEGDSVVTPPAPEEMVLVETPVTIEKWQPMQLIIPAISLDFACVGNGDIFDVEFLRQGPAHFPTSDLPGTEKGNVAFAGRWDFFADINDLKEGDEIYLDVAAYRFIYKVIWKEIVDQHCWEKSIGTTESPSITLQTSYPIYASNPSSRLNVRGELVKVLKTPGN